MIHDPLERFARMLMERCPCCSGDASTKDNFWKLCTVCMEASRAGRLSHDCDRRRAQTEGSGT